MPAQANEYSEFQKEFYTAETPNMRVENHRSHNRNPDYWNILLGPVREDSARWAGKVALDVGCGCGRNVLNLSRLALWSSVDGADISGPNCEETRRLMREHAPEVPVTTFETNGFELDGVPDSRYDFVMSTIVLQHICVHEVRFNLMREVFRVMRPGGLFSFQMGFGENQREHATYFENAYHARATNDGFDVAITNPSDLVGDLEQIGFAHVTYRLTGPWDNERHPQWIWVKASRP